MRKDVYYHMQADKPDPRSTGDTLSWFFYYKWRAGNTWVSAKDGCMSAEVDDTLHFFVDNVFIGITTVKSVVERNLQGEKEIHFNSDRIDIPVGTELVSLEDIPEDEEPVWLKNLRTKRRQ